MPVFHVLCCDTVPHSPGCPCGLGPQPYSHGSVPARCLPPWAAGAPAPAYHSCLWASAWPHCIPGAACPPASPATGLNWSLGPPSTWDRMAPATLRTTFPRQNKPDPVTVSCPCIGPTFGWAVMATLGRSVLPLNRGYWPGDREPGSKHV